MIVTHSHFRTIPASRGAGYCSRGGRAWFARYGLDWSDFVRNGIDEQALLATGDGMAIGLVKWAHVCEEQERSGG
ncbi:MAG: hypothetical protein ACREO4_16335 [Lysobacter sp.]